MYFNWMEFINLFTLFIATEKPKIIKPKVTQNNYVVFLNNSERMEMIKKQSISNSFLKYMF